MQINQSIQEGYFIFLERNFAQQILPWRNKQKNINIEEVKPRLLCAASVSLLCISKYINSELVGAYFTKTTAISCINMSWKKMTSEMYLSRKVIN